MHEGGYTIINTDFDEQQIDAQFIQQLKTSDTAQFEFEKNLRHDQKSFNSVRKLMPSVYRFRVIDVDGKDVGERELGMLSDSTRVGCREGMGEYCVPLLYDRRIVEKERGYALSA